MPGFIGQSRHQKQQVFRQVAPPGTMAVRNDNGGYTFVPWKRQTPPTRDAAQSNSHTIAQHIASQYTIRDVVVAMTAIDQRMSALEAKRAQQRQLAEQQQLAPRQQPLQQPMQPVSQPTHDHAPTCACQHQPPAPRAPHQGVPTMDTARHPGLAPSHIVESPPRRTRDQNNFGENPSRFTSGEADRMARHVVGAGPPTQRELNDAYAAHWARDAGAAPLGASGVNERGNMHEAVSSDPSERFIGSGPFTQFRNDDVRPSPGALSTLNSEYNKAKTPAARDAIMDAWKSYLTAPRDAVPVGGGFKARQPLIPPQAPNADNTKDAPAWQGLYEANSGGRGAGLTDPNKIGVGQELSMPGGGAHTVTSGETLSSIAAGASGGDLGSKSLAAERGGVSPTGGDYSSGGQTSGETGGTTEVPRSLGSSAPTPPVRPAGLGGQEESGGASSSSGSGAVPTPPVKPASFGGTGESPNGLNPRAAEGGGASPTGSEGTPLAGFVRNLVGDAKPRGGKPRGRK